VLTEAQREALGALADLFTDDGIVVDAANIRAALASLRTVEGRAEAAEAEVGRLRTQLEDSRRKLNAFEAASANDGWRKRAEAAEGEVERLTRERNEARAAVPEILASLKEQGQAADAAEATVARLRDRIGELEKGLREAAEAMRGCQVLAASGKVAPVENGADEGTSPAASDPEEKPGATVVRLRS
jgi:chromosome segregation ATPase